MADYLGRILGVDEQLATEDGDGLLIEVGKPRLPRFRPPTRPGSGIPADDRRPAWRMWRRLGGTRVGQHVWQTPEGEWRQGIPSTDDLRVALRHYAGGKVHKISEAEADVLEAAGFTVDR